MHFRNPISKDYNFTKILPGTTKETCVCSFVTGLFLILTPHFLFLLLQRAQFKKNQSSGYIFGDYYFTV